MPSGLSPSEIRAPSPGALAINPHPMAPGQPITPENHPGQYGGALAVGGQQFSFVTGGGGRGSSPPGDHEITGYRTDGAFAGRGGAFTVADVYDPKVGDTRSAVEIHPSSRGATAGCFGVPAAQWPWFQAECQKVLAANGGHAFLHVDSNGNARIDGNPTGANAATGASGGGAPTATVGMSGVGWKDDDPAGADKIHQYLAAGGHDIPRGENWCAAWLSATLNHAGIPELKGAAGNVASNYATYGTPVDAKDVQPGDIMVGGMEGRQPGERGAHVAIVTGPASGGKIPIVEGDQRNDITSYATSPGSVYSKVSTGPAYTGGHGIATNSVGLNESGMLFRRPPAPVGGPAPGLPTGSVTGVSGAGTPLTPGGDYGTRVKNIESSGGRTSLNLYQFQPGTWAQYGAKYGSITDPTAQEKAFADLTAANRTQLTTSLGRAPTDGELYLAHQQGVPGAAALIKNPTTPAGQLVPPANITGNRGDPNAPASQFVQQWTSRFAGGPSPSGSAPSSVPSANGTPFTDEQLRANPGLGTAYTDLVAGDMRNRTKAAETQGAALDTAVSNHFLPAPEALAQYTQLAQDIPGEQERLARITGGAQGLIEKQGGGGIGGGLGPGTVPGSGSGSYQAYQQQVAAAMQRGGDLFSAGVAAAHTKMLDSEAEFAKSHPLEYSQRKGWSQPPPPIDFNNPQSIAQGFAANAQITAGVARREPGVSASAIPENQKPQVLAWMADNQHPMAAQGILDAIKALPAASRDATIADPDISKAILGMAKSGDPTKAEAANSLMDQVQRQNPLTFEDKFGKPAVAELSDWNARRQFLSPDQLLDEAKKAKDPATLAAQNVWKGQADDALKKVSPNDIVNGMVGTGARWNPFGADYKPISDAPALALGTLKTDYDEAYRFQFGRTGDQNSAEAFAKETLGKKYTFSPSNGGRLTAWAPETSDAYPQVNGSKDYIGDQLKAFMTAQGHPGAKAYLVPDTQTDAEIHTTGTPPSYRVVAQGSDGQYHALPTTSRFSADPRAAQTRANEDFMTANRPTSQGSPPWEWPGKLLPQGKTPNWGAQGQGPTFGGQTW